MPTSSENMFDHPYTRVDYRPAGPSKMTHFEQMVVLVRGLPGSGKTTLARVWTPPSTPVLAADDFFVGEDGLYRFDPSCLPPAHADCLQRARHAFRTGGAVVVTNTFSQRWEMEPYRALAEEQQALLHVYDIYDRGLTDDALAARNVHGVPVTTITAMRARWEHDWMAGDPRPPWER